MKTIKLFGKHSAGALLALMLTVVFMASCKNEPPVEPEKKCDHKATFVYNEGTKGYYGDYVIQLASGETVKPVSSEDGLVHPGYIYDGMEITVSYKLTGEHKIALHDESGILPGGCVVYPDAHITCITAPKVNKCGTPTRGFCGNE